MPATSPVDSLTMVIRKMNASGLAYMLTGSVAALFYGRQRTTVDVDVVIDCAGLNVDKLIRTLEPEFFLDEEHARTALAEKTTFSALPLVGGPKVDFIPLADGSFDQVSFMRRHVLDWFGAPVFITSGMDLALHTLRTAKERKSARLLADTREILSNDVVDDAHEFYRWIRELGLQLELEASRSSEFDA